MAKGHWSFLHEWVIYDYLIARSEEGTLRLKKVVSSGRYMAKPIWVKVSSVKPIVGTAFPDIQAIAFQKQKDIFRPAEVKFTTALFNYHNEEKYAIKFNEFVERNGFVIVASHDYLPKGLTDRFKAVDVCEIEIEDFITFCRENFARLLNRQIKSHTSTRVWLMYQGPNFNEGTNRIRPGRESRIWCPTENLNGFDLTIGDRVLFCKTNGLGRMELQKKYLQEGKIDIRWMLSEIVVTEVKSKIFGRKEYLDFKKLPYDTELWKNDPVEKERYRWNRVFEFSIVKVIQNKHSMERLYSISGSKSFAERCFETFCYGKSRELSLKSYRDLLEVLA
jgi:hypothetical protein